MSANRAKQNSPATDEDLAYRPVGSLSVVEVVDEALVYDRDNDVLHHLDPIAFAVWNELDGLRSVADVSATLAKRYGAPLQQVSTDVSQLVSTLVESQLLITGFDSPPTAAETASTTLKPQSESLKASDRTLPYSPSPCGDTVSQLGWVATDAIERGGWVLGVRSSDEATRRAVLERWNDNRVDVPEVPANVSIRPPGTSTADTSELGQVYAECTLVARQRDLESLLTAVERELEGRLFRTRSDGISLQVTVVRRGGSEIWLAPVSWWYQALNRQSALRKHGIELLARDVFMIDNTLSIAGVEGTHPVSGVYSGIPDVVPPAVLVSELSRWVNNGDLCDRTSIIERFATLVPSLRVIPGSLAANPLES